MPAAYADTETVGPDPVFRLPETSLTSYREAMTVRDEVLIAGVPWPVYKLAALLIGAVVLIGVGVVTASAALAVLTAAASTTVVWLGLRVAASRR
jgi:hypothetical protein